jgi:phospholipase C
MYSVAATSGGCVTNTNMLTGLRKVLDANGNMVDHPAHFTASEIATTLPNELEKKGLTWKYIAETIPNDTMDQLLTLLENNTDGTLDCMDVATSLPSFKQNFISTVPDLPTNLPALLAQGQVGNVVWIKPAAKNCEHPGVASVQTGADWTKAVVNAIGASPYWGKCAIFITYDDFGGFYDHVSPPQVDAMGLGFRVPCTILSPYAKKGFIDHTQYEHSSMLKFSEKLFDIAPMTARDAAANDMMNAFDFTQTPRDFSEFKF